MLLVVVVVGVSLLVVEMEMEIGGGGGGGGGAPRHVVEGALLPGPPSGHPSPCTWLAVGGLPRVAKVEYAPHPA